MTKRIAPENGPVAFFTTDHRVCDEEWAAVEQAADAGDAAMAAAWQAFDAGMRRHFAMEEEVLFPAFEQATGITRGPTAMMRIEHQQMRGLLDQMAQAAAAKRWNDLLDAGDTLLMVIQQHNAKEEGMLYPMCASHLGTAWSSVADRLAKY